MLSPRPTPRLGRARISLALVVALAGAMIALFAVAGANRLSAAASPALEATIFTYNGTDFVRAQTSLSTESGHSAVGTKLNHATAAFRALTAKHSYVGDAALFGKSYRVYYAPLTDAKGGLTGAIFIGVPK